jgi:hypothetical protein
MTVALKSRGKAPHPTPLYDASQNSCTWSQRNIAPIILIGPVDLQGFLFGAL